MLTSKNHLKIVFERIFVLKKPKFTKNCLVSKALQKACCQDDSVFCINIPKSASFGFDRDQL